MKFKNIKKNSPDGGKKPKSPSNSRTIPESMDRVEVFTSVYRLSLKIFILIIFLLTAVIVGLDLNSNFQAKQSIDSEREKLTKDLKFWENFIAKHQDYKDAYFQASILEYKLGDSSRAKMYAEKGLDLDPNSENGKRLEEFLNK